MASNDKLGADKPAPGEEKLACWLAGSSSFGDDKTIIVINVSKAGGAGEAAALLVGVILALDLKIARMAAAAASLAGRLRILGAAAAAAAETTMRAYANSLAASCNATLCRLTRRRSEGKQVIYYLLAGERPLFAGQPADMLTSKSMPAELPSARSSANFVLIKLSRLMVGRRGERSQVLARMSRPHWAGQHSFPSKAHFHFHLHVHLEVAPPAGLQVGATFGEPAASVLGVRAPKRVADRLLQLAARRPAQQVSAEESCCHCHCRLRSARRLRNGYLACRSQALIVRPAASSTWLQPLAQPNPLPSRGNGLFLREF